MQAWSIAVKCDPDSNVLVIVIWAELPLVFPPFSPLLTKQPSRRNLVPRSPRLSSFFFPNLVLLMQFYWMSQTPFKFGQRWLGRMSWVIWTIRNILIYIFWITKPLFIHYPTFRTQRKKEFGFRIDIDTLDLSSNVSILNRKFLTFNS